MSKTLVIVESPAKAKTISRYLGKDYTVKASVGHVRDLPASTLGVNVDRDFKPLYITMKGKETVVRELKKLGKNADEILLATDPDREGEAIAWHLTHILKLDPKSPCRVTFNEITKKTVLEQIKNPRPIDMDLVDAQQARRILDRLVGYELSPLLWKKIRKGLSAGRVQSVATRMIVAREREIKAFVPEEYWLLTGFFNRVGEQEVFRARYHGVLEGDKIKKAKLPNKEAVDDVMAQLEDPYRVYSLEKRERKRHSYPPFTTSTLQQQASRALGFTSSRTMRVAQQLYEGVELKDQGATSLITYIRTDSTRITPDAIGAARGFIERAHGKEYLPAKGRMFRNKKSSQDAHEAIRPIHFDMDPQSIRGELTNDQFRLYKLIWDKFIASQMTAAIFDTVTANIESNRQIFRVRGETMKFAGWLKQYGQTADNDKDDEDSDDDELKKESLPELREGDTLKCQKLDPEQKFTQPPPRYNEASLIRAMEELGIGRPSTYAPTISTILSRRYVEKDGRQLVPTDLGFTVTEMLEENFRDIVDTDFTAQLEDELDTVESGDADWVELLKQFYPKFKKDVDEANETIEKIEIPVVPTGEKCPKCETGDLVIKEGRYGKFIACNNYPDCDFTKNIEIKAPGKCPLCGSGLLKKTTRKRRSSVFYVCDKKIDPDCKFISWDLPVEGKTCDTCGSYMVEKRFRGKKYLRCGNKDCPTNKRKSSRKKAAKKEKDTESDAE